MPERRRGVQRATLKFFLDGNEATAQQVADRFLDGDTYGVYNLMSLVCRKANAMNIPLKMVKLGREPGTYKITQDSTDGYNGSTRVLRSTEHKNGTALNVVKAQLKTTPEVAGWIYDQVRASQSIASQIIDVVVATQTLENQTFREQLPKEKK